MIKPAHALLAALLLAAPAAQAHGIWLAQRQGDLTVVYGVGPQDEAYAPEKIVSVSARGASGEPGEAALTRGAKGATVQAPAGAAAVATVLDNGFWSKGPDGRFVNKPKREVPGATASSRSIKTNLHLLAARAPRAEGLALEIVPLTDPMTLKVGDELPVQVLHEGAPLRGVALRPDYVNDANTQAAKTDAEGKAKVALRNDGLNVIGASFSKPTSDSADADRLSYFATLSFVLPFKEE